MTALKRPDRLPSEILREDGWCRGEMKDDQGRHCLEGALWEAIPPIGGGDPVYAAIHKAIPTSHSDWLLTEWNDAQTSAEPVIAVCEEAERILGWRS